ncbi:aspartic proteinase CDR1-like [Lotus japonicus]|uniref:aspartic proteinase CDR1-like n=1 Tax=Lotus japonicus TaxID=34305 RepID=UPI00258B1C0B|nr:aspartic proteinase CDR1-like [Lotus japonicus]
MTCYSLVLLIFCLCGVSLTESLRNGFSVELIHRDSSKSPFHRPAETHFQRVSNVVRRSFNRANHFNKASTSNPKNTPKSNHVIPDDGDYIMSYSVGTPKYQLYGIVDTGSDLVWLQCQPCKSCYNQTTPIFDPSKSKTYKNLPCSSSVCQSVPVSTCSSNNTCKYTANYGDGSKSDGDVSVETLTLDSTSGSPISFPKIVIGCGHDNTGLFHGRASGIVGLGRGSVSLTTQLDTSIGGKFSYCLVPMISVSANASSKLNFGDVAIVSGNRTVSTPIIQNIDLILNNFYVLNLEAFSVGDKKVDFVDSPFGSSGVNIIIDSGTTLTLLPDDIYKTLESAVSEAVDMKPIEDPESKFSLCYEGTLDDLMAPIITAHFKGADVQLSSLNTFFQVRDQVVCFAFASSNSVGVAIFGNLAQQNFLVGYDLKNKIVSFKPTNCTNQ